jgi:O-antigen/teichoic acid export membrane protein
MLSSKIKFYLQSFSNRPQALKLFSTLLQLSGEKIIRLFLGLLVQTQVARYLGPEKLGQVNYIIEFSLLFTLIVSFGLDEYYIKYFTITKTKVGDVLSVTLGNRLILALFAYLGLVISAYIIKGYDILIFSLISIFSLVIFSKAFEVLDFRYQATMNMVPVVRARQIGYFSTSVFKIFAVIFSFTWVAFVFISMWEFISARFLIYRNFVTTEKIPKITFSWQSLYKELKFGYPFFLISIFFFLEFKMGIFMSSKILGVRSLGYLAVVINLLSIADFFSQILLNSTIPAIINVHSSPRLLQRRLRYLLLAIFSFCSFLLLGTVFLGEWFIGLLFGAEYKEVSNILPWGILFLAVNAFNHLRFRWFIIEEEVSRWMVFHAFGFIIAFLLQLSLLERFGAKFVFVSVVLGHFISFIFSLLNKKHREFLILLIKKF